MTKRAVKAKRKPRPGEVLPAPVMIDKHSVITNFEEVRLAARGLDTFTIYRAHQEPVEVQGHEIGMATTESEKANLPIYQIVEYLLVTAEARITKAFNPGEELAPQAEQTLKVENVDGSEEYIKVVKAILWPGTYDIVTRDLGE